MTAAPKPCNYLGPYPCPVCGCPRLDCQERIDYPNHKPPRATAMLFCHSCGSSFEFRIRIGYRG